MRTPYQVLDSWDASTAALLDLAAHRVDEVLFARVVHLRELRAEMYESLQEAQRVRLEEQLAASVKLVGCNHI